MTAATDEDFYRPGQRVTGRVEAAYFFGKPVDGGRVQLSGWVYDVGRQQVLDLSGQTDAGGGFPFEFDLPGYLVGGLESGVADYILEVAVTDGAAHTEQVSIRIPVAQQGILVEAVPESGTLKPGLENIVYLMTAYPDGSPAECEVRVVINGGNTRPRPGLRPLAADAGFIYADLRSMPRMRLPQRPAQKYVEGQEQGAMVLLRPERATYRVGETMEVGISTEQRVDLPRHNTRGQTRPPSALMWPAQGERRGRSDARPVRHADAARVQADVIRPDRARHAAGGGGRADRPGAASTIGQGIVSARRAGVGHDRRDRAGRTRRPIGVGAGGRR